MNRVHEQLIAQNFKSRMLLQVHDELVFEVAPGELDRLRNLATEIMENVVKLRVPLEVQIGIGQTWDEAGH
jgi:DNA polymerase-1